MVSKICFSGCCQAAEVKTRTPPTARPLSFRSWRPAIVRNLWLNSSGAGNTTPSLLITTTFPLSSLKRRPASEPLSARRAMIISRTGTTVPPYCFCRRATLSLRFSVMAGAGACSAAATESTDSSNTSARRIRANAARPLSLESGAINPSFSYAFTLK